MEIARKTLLPSHGSTPTSDWTDFRTMKTDRIPELQAEIRHWYLQKAVPLQAWSGPEGSRKLKFPDYMTTAQDGGKTGTSKIQV